MYNLKSLVNLFHKCTNTKIELLSIVREDDSDDEEDDQSEEVYDVNERKPPKKESGQISLQVFTRTIQEKLY